MPLPDALAGNFQDAIRWFNQLWGGVGDPSGAARAAGAAGLPSMMMPTLDVKELDKRISDLRSVEQWLNLNLGLLRTTIQGLEMQRSALSAWQALGTAAAPAGAASSGAAARSDSASTPEAAPTFQPALWWAALQQQFAQMAASAAAPASAATTPKEETAGGTGSDTQAPGTGAKSPGKTKSSTTSRPG